MHYFLTCKYSTVGTKCLRQEIQFWICRWEERVIVKHATASERQQMSPRIMHILKQLDNQVCYKDH